MVVLNLTVFAVLIGAALGSTLYVSRPLSKDGPSSGSRIINGMEATPGEFPHQVTLLNNGYHSCGGSVIANDWVLTAAHCVDGQTLSSLAVVVDLHDFSNPGSSYIWFDIAQIIMHNNYNKGPGGFPNDVALLRLSRSTQPDITKNIIELAPEGTSFAGDRCTISGWGTTETGNGAVVLMKADVDVLTKTQCAVYWGSSILDQHVCIWGQDTAQGSGSCNGDSGGPLVCRGFLAGVTSWGRSGCHDNGFVTSPSIYASVSHFRSWVNSNCGGCL
ncbi:chymotrypsin-1-like [Mya arenaria]|uniref:chymotrypsin-1-like n=1 Tax=Mya arenaria TaxID=6604 RepID=UPI0022E38E6C|nr:chymotrypsin-1-like [Mya arenaria]